MTSNKKNGWKTVNGNRYFFDKKTGRAHVGWLTRPTGVFCFNANGVRYENTQLISTSGKIYIIDSDGKRYSNGWCTYRGEKYYIDKEGYAHTEWLRKGGKWYYFDKTTGIMYRNRSMKLKVGGKKYKFDKNGVCINRK